MAQLLSETAQKRCEQAKGKRLEGNNDVGAVVAEGQEEATKVLAEHVEKGARLLTESQATAAAKKTAKCAYYVVGKYKAVNGEGWTVGDCFADFSLDQIKAKVSEVAVAPVALVEEKAFSA